MAVIAIPRPLRDKLGDGGDIVSLVEEKFERRLATVEATLIKWMFIWLL